MAINDKITDEKQQYNINRKTAKVSELLSGEIDKYKYLTGEEIFPFDLRRVIEQAKFTYSPLRKALVKQKKRLKSRKKTLRCLKSSKIKSNIKN